MIDNTLTKLHTQSIMRNSETMDRLAQKLTHKVCKLLVLSFCHTN